MSTLNEKEKRDLQNVFDAISDVKPVRKKRFSQLKFLMHLSRFLPMISLSSRLFSGHV